MIWLALVGSAWSAPPSVDLNNLDGYIDGASALLNMPAGCWDVQGNAWWKWDLGKFGRESGTAPFFGRVEDGVWVGYQTRGHGLTTAAGLFTSQFRAGSPYFTPMVGRHPSDRLAADDDNPVNVLRYILDDLTTDVGVAYTRWSTEDQGVWLDQERPIRKGRRPPTVKIDAFFPLDSTDATAIDLVFPERFHVGSFIRYRVSDAQVHIKTHVNEPLRGPMLEEFSATIGFLGMEFSGYQTIHYMSMTPCWKPDWTT